MACNQAKRLGVTISYSSKQFINNYCRENLNISQIKRKNPKNMEQFVKMQNFKTILSKNQLWYIVEHSNDANT